jgi:hypothetical protein
VLIDHDRPSFRCSRSLNDTLERSRTIDLALTVSKVRIHPSVFSSRSASSFAWAVAAFVGRSGLGAGAAAACVLALCLRVYAQPVLNPVLVTRAVGVPEPAVAAMKSTPRWQALEALSHTLPYDVRLTSDAPGILTRARALHTPTLLLDGDQSPPWMRAGVARLVQAIPEARSRSLAGQTHDVDPAALAPSLREFFAELGPRPD